MRFIFIAVVVVVVGCTKPNPNRCCVDAADCAANNIPITNTCSDGLVCRGNQCIAETCASSSECESSEPYCVSGLCGSSCDDDTQCPGAAQAAGNSFCVGGECVACRVGMNDCSATAPVCDSGACRTCVADTECPSNVCDIDRGTCIVSSSIRYAAANGIDINDCSESAPCTVNKAFSIADSGHPWVRMLPGDFSTSTTISVPGVTMTVVGTNATLTRTTVGTAIDMVAASGLTIRGLVVNPIGPGLDAVYCHPPVGTAAVLHLRASVLKAMVQTLGACQLMVDESDLQAGVDVGNNTTTMIDRSRISGSTVQTDSSTATLSFSITNSISGAFSPVFVASTTPNAFTVYAAYNTFYDDTGNIAGRCPHISGGSAPATTATYVNNIFDAPGVSNALMMDTTCTVDTNIVFPQTAAAGTNAIIQDPKLVDPLTGDFHLMPGSPAIDAAKTIANDSTVDFDGTTRPQGARNDIGAFEYH